METTKQKEIRAQTADLRIEQRSNSAEPSRTITGYALKFDTWSEPICGWFKEKISRTAFDGCDISDVIMCFNHDSSKLLARTISNTLTLIVDDIGLKFVFDAPKTELGNEMLELVERGDIRGCSFSFYVERDSWTYADKDNHLELDERTVEKISLLKDTSLVVFPAYSDTDVSLRSLEQRKKNFLDEKMSEEQKNNTANLNPTSRYRKQIELLNLKS